MIFAATEITNSTNGINLEMQKVTELNLFSTGKGGIFIYCSWLGIHLKTWQCM